MDKSLVRFDDERFAMLETIREYAASGSGRRTKRTTVHRRHAEFFLVFAESADMSAEHDYGRRYDIFPPEQDNLRAAIDWSLAAGEIEPALRIAIALENFWVITDPFEGMRRFEALLAASGDLDPTLRARALRCYSGSCHIAGNNESSRRAIEESLELFRAAGDDFGVAVLLQRLGVSKLATGESGARELFEESLALFRRTGSRRGEGETIGSLGYLEQEEGHLERAIECYEESAAIVAPLGFTWWEANMLAATAEGLSELGRHQEAAAKAAAGLGLAVEIQDRQNTVYLMGLLALAAAASGELDRAGRLWGAVEAEADRRPVGIWEAEREEYAAKIFSHRGPELERGLAEGRLLSFEAAVDEALRAAAASR